MSDIAASERRLSAALDRIDTLLEYARRSRGDQPVADGLADGALRDELEQVRAENLRLTSELQALQQGQSGSGAQADALDRMTGAAHEAARLAAANDELAETNRALIAAQRGQGDGTEAAFAALESEIVALRAARAAEVAQMSEIMAELERLLGGAPAFGDAATAAATSDEVSDAPELVRERDSDGDSTFGAVYDDAADDDFDADDESEVR